MKKIISLLLVVFFSISLYACGTSDNPVGDKIVLSKEEFESYCEYVELTTENWNDYIEIVEKEYVYRDAFGEEIERGTNTFLTLKEHCYISRENAIRLTYTRKYENGSNSIVTEDFVFSGTVARDIHLIIDKEQDIVCEKVMGTIRKITAPDDKWNVDEKGKKYLYVKIDKGFYQIIDEDAVDFKSE